MTEFLVLIRRRLIQDPAVKAIVGPRVFAAIPQEVQPLPLILMSVADDATSQSMGGSNGSAMSRLVIECQTDDYDEARELKQACRIALDGFMGRFDGVEIGHTMHLRTYDFSYDPIAGHDLPPATQRMDFSVYHSETVALTPPTIDEPAGPPVDPSDPTDPTDPTDPVDPPPTGELPAWPAMTPSAEMVEQFGGTGSWDTGVTKRATYAVAKENWYGDVFGCWYPGKFNGTYPNPLSITDWLNGLPDGVSIHQGTIDRVRAYQPDATFYWYTSLLRGGTLATLAAEGIWPNGRALITPDYDDDWFNPAYNTPNDLYAEEKGIAYQLAACREVHGREYARMLARMKARHPQLTRVYSDNFAARDVVPTIDWSSLCLLAKSATAKMRAEFNVAIALIVNVTCHYRTDLRADLDLLAAADVAGIHNEGLLPEHTTRSSEWANIIRNIQHWLAKSWPGGGRRYFATLARSTDSDGMNRLAEIVSATPAANSIDITLATPHYLADTSVWRVSTSGFHAALTSDYAVTPHETNPNRLTLTLTGAPANGYTTGEGSGAKLCFLYSGREVDAGFLHSLRNATDCCRASWIQGAADSRSYVPPIWRTWASQYGYAIGPIEKISDHNVDLANYGSAGLVPCVKHFRTPFAGGWYLHVDISTAERRAWWQLGA